MTVIVPDEYPHLDIVISIGTWSIVEPVYLDTGHEGGLVIPSHLRHEILARWEYRSFRLADGRTVLAPAWSGTVEVEGREFKVEIAAMGPRFLLGREVLDQMLVCFDRGRQLTVET